MQEAELFKPGEKDDEIIKSVRHLLALDGYWYHTRQELGQKKFDEYIRQEEERLYNILSGQPKD